VRGAEGFMRGENDWKTRPILLFSESRTFWRTGGGAVHFVVGRVKSGSIAKLRVCGFAQQSRREKFFPRCWGRKTGSVLSH
jgi:hypothetical protein